MSERATTNREAGGRGLVPAKSVTKRRDLHNPAGELERFIGICAQARKQLDPENVVANVGKALGGFFEGLDEDSKSMVKDLAGKLRLPK